MRVLHVQRVNAVGGSERHLLALLPALRGIGVDVTLAVFASGGYRSFIEMADAAGVRTIVIEQRRHLDRPSLRALAAEVQEIRPDVLHTHLIHADLYGSAVARRARLPHVSTVHGFYPQMRGPGLVGIKITVANAWKVIAISEFLAGWLDAHSSKTAGKVEVIHYGTELPEKGSIERLGASFRREQGLTDETVVGIAARVIPGKGHEPLIRSFEIAARSDPSLRLWVAGDGPLKKEMEELAAGLLPEGSYRFFGHIPEVEPFIAGVDMLCFPTMPSCGEGFGLAALEGMSMARPVMASDNSSLPEVVGRDDAGLLLPSGDISSWATAIQRLASDDVLRAEIGARARERAAALFRLDTMAKRTKSLYESVLENVTRTGPHDPPRGRPR